MTEFAIERLTYTWKGEWNSGNFYQRDDVVSLNGSSYVCLVGHTASQNFTDDLNAVLPQSDPPQLQPRWVLMVTGISFRGDWVSGTEYNKNQLVYYKGSVYVCKVDHVASVFSQDIENWNFFAFHIDYLGEWLSATDYADGSLVKYNGIVYKCIVPHTSQSVLEADLQKWQVFYNGVDYRSSWQPSTEFRKNDLVKFGGSIFRCTQTHTSQSNFDEEKFEIEFPGYQFESEWNETTEYQIGDVVRRGGVLYVAVTNHINSDPYTDKLCIYWQQLSASFNFRGEWSFNNEYNTGDVVQRGGQLFVAKRQISLTSVDGEAQYDGSTLDYLDTDWWELLIPGSVFSQVWETNKRYSVGDIVYYNGTAYRANIEHISSIEDYPGDNGNIYDYWDTFIQAGQPGGLNYKGEILTFGLSREETGDGSTLGDTALAIGTTEDVLSVSEELEVFWRKVEVDGNVVYVSPNGVDDDEFDRDRGLSLSKPFRTVKYACSYIEDNFAPGTLSTVKVSTGTFEEIAPIIVPAGTAIFGDELRSTTIKPNQAILEYQDDFKFVEDAIDHLATFILPVLSNNAVEPSPGNDQEQLFNTTTTDINGVNRILSQIQIFQDYVNFRLHGGENDPVLSGSNVPNQDIAEVNAALALWENRKFIAAESWAYLQNKYPEQTFTRTRVQDDFITLFRGVRRDLENSGNYGTLLAGERYENAANGSERENLFYMRDTTGMRGLTLRGLLGNLLLPVEGKEYGIVDGGAYVSLDPGWGPADQRTWIINRSPYIQGVTTIGTRCVGKRLDGTLHNGGNRSMVSNDFTQVLSDGIGIWISDNARTELVSVFSYYCAVGYLAETGGVIRATNGNNSYGRFGSIADGSDPAETPQVVSAFTRNNEALVQDAISGGTLSEILVFEYRNAGEEYTTANADIIGAGDFASVEFSDLRDSAIFNGKISGFDDSATVGGSGYTQQQGFCQFNSNGATEITLSANDSNQIDTDYIGQRVIIISGPAAGQYAVIDTYNPTTKDATVVRESDGEPGWDHVVGGTPALGLLDTNNQYRVEPRVDVDQPPFEQEYSNLPFDRTYTDSVYGEITQIYADVELPTGSQGDPEVLDQSAVIEVTKSGRDYSATITDGGAGYAAGDSFVISGTEFDGSSPNNDLIVEIIQVSEDSTNSIISLEVDGTGRAGRLVNVANPNLALYSDNGRNYTEVTLPFVGDFTRIISGNNRFVAVASLEDKVAFSLDGETWSERPLPELQNWVDGVYGNDLFVIISNNSNAVAYSSSGETWEITEIPEDTDSDSTADSTVPAYQFVTYGKGKFVALSTSDRATATSNDGITWTRNDSALPQIDDENLYDFIALTYGDNKFVAITSIGECFYSFDGINWIEGNEPRNAGESSGTFITLKYYQGIFLAIDNVGSLYTSYNCLSWQKYVLDQLLPWTTFGVASFGTRPEWFLFADSTTINGVGIVRTGKPAIMRPFVRQGQISFMKIWDPGSGYDSAAPPAIVLFDNVATVEAAIEPRLGSGVLAQPDFINRGAGYVSSQADVLITGDGFADVIPADNILTINNVSNVPDIGSQVLISGVFDNENPTQLKEFSAARVTNLGDDGTNQGTSLVEIQVSPALTLENDISNGDTVTIIENLSKIRLTNHDFLDIGTGNFELTNYPEIYAGGNFFTATPSNEVREFAGGRVFYVSTDQDGNFRGGDLFAVNQATGIITISAEFFDLQGLDELSLGGIRLGGSGTVVREFSTDPNFTQDSDNIVPTQRAVASFLAQRLSVGGENLETNTLISGRIRLGGPANTIDVIAEPFIDIPRQATLQGTDPRTGAPTHISGTMITQSLLLRSFDDSMQ